ncbi:hypothetical protein SLA2020_495340 [Shorea laevis]
MGGKVPCNHLFLSRRGGRIPPYGRGGSQRLDPMQPNCGARGVTGDPPMTHPTTSYVGHEVVTSGEVLRDPPNGWGGPRASISFAL